MGGTCSDFTVNIDALTSFSSTLNSIQGLMKTAMDSLENTGCQGIGTADLDGACSDFAHAWKYGIDQIGSKVKDTVGGVDDAAKAYRQADDAVASAMNKFQAALG